MYLVLFCVIDLIISLSTINTVYRSRIIFINEEFRGDTQHKAPKRYAGRLKNTE